MVVTLFKNGYILSFLSFFKKAFEDQIHRLGKILTRELDEFQYIACIREGGSDIQRFNTVARGDP